MYFMNYKKITGMQFVPELSSCILGAYDINTDNSRIINTVMLLVKMFIMLVLSCVLFYPPLIF